MIKKKTSPFLLTDVGSSVFLAAHSMYFNHYEILFLQLQY